MGSGMGTRGKRGAGSGGAHWDLTIECLCGTYSRTVRSIRDLTVDAVDSVAPVRPMQLTHVDGYCVCFTYEIICQFSSALKYAQNGVTLSSTSLEVMHNYSNKLSTVLIS